MLVYFIQKTDEPDLQVINTVKDNKHTISVEIPRSDKPSTTVYLIPDPNSNFIMATTNNSNTDVWRVEPINISSP